ncbi:glucose-6-phosphate 1-dehydrogenase [Capsaspora owczarzaki ATCC 30864]|uniref:Glucose-6-phosphate 1-dehydrogenase n=1 Tax=Capsaspora owczarzaki (strain ATCC 30864) TaxID=595528 RepID=A0A0D2X2D0_CAPO3|nr:glucose-6-phosphate 1-dehydrogenase [Capsaspora owczarzaki ATCC 30864]KJE92344.1 glucose-6-phosphate 1-dehydrogenase [Capsaspora owczarzaki ATCC 30864]|eukprot:XP_004364168.2 glucose-6-phosphate 1-dehydrogenase [Capsaspora owczarzaki ATCC 30864]
MSSSPTSSSSSGAPSAASNNPTTVFVFGASGDLAKKKTFPALFALFRSNLLPTHTRIVGYARSAMTPAELRERLSKFIRTPTDQDKKTLDEFFKIISYVHGQYDSDEDVIKLAKAAAEVEKKCAQPSSDCATDRVFYLALPPSVFIPISQQIKRHLTDNAGYKRLIVEKPFGKDLASSTELADALAANFAESEIYRIDHYLGKEMVKNLLILRFANVFFGAVWNRQFINNVQITFKEPFGVEGRGGYFDEYGIIRDVMQNHLMQILAIVAMDRPVDLSAEAIRDEKVKVLKSIPHLTVHDVIVGQYTRSGDGKVVGYLELDDVPKDSITPTFAQAVLHIKNERWDGVPFILKCGKAMPDRKAEIRIQFQDVAGNIFPHDLARNELVIRVQPDEAVYIKLMNKKPGLSTETVISELDLSYKQRYGGDYIPDAYEALILDVLRGDHANFVRSDELDVAWRIFTPMLHELERAKHKPEPYEFGSRGPSSADEQLKRHGGFTRHSQPYTWVPPAKH